LRTFALTGEGEGLPWSDGEGEGDASASPLVGGSLLSFLSAPLPCRQKARGMNPAGFPASDRRGRTRRFARFRFLLLVVLGLLLLLLVVAAGFAAAAGPGRSSVAGPFADLSVLLLSFCGGGGGVGDFFGFCFRRSILFFTSSRFAFARSSFGSSFSASS